MRVLLANLKHFYQRRGLWIAYVGLTIVAWLMVQWVLPTPGKGRGVFGGFLVCSFLWGLLVATTQMETASKPFSFCLPGHRDVVRKLVFLAGFVVSLALVLVFAALLASPSFVGPLEFYLRSPGVLILLKISYFCASMTAYLLGAGVAFSLTRGGGSALGLIALVVALCAMFDVFTPIQYPLLHWPVAVIAVALAVGLASWWWLGRRAWFRRSCTKPWMGFFDPWDRRNAQRFRELYAIRFVQNVPPAWDRYFQRVIGRRPPSDLGKYVWGALYTTCVLVGPQWKGILALALVWLALGGYSRAAAPMVMGFLPLMTVGFLQSPLGTALLVAGGRRERFFATVALILGFSVVWVLLFGVLVGLTHLLAPVVPAVTVRGDTLSLHAISFQVVWIPLVLVPVVGLVQTLFCRKPVWLALSIMLVTAILMLFTSPLGLYRAITPMVMSGATVLTWGICLLILYRIALHSDLVRQ
jgi:hypothetical protein